MSETTERLTQINEYNGGGSYPEFVRQLLIALDSRYPFAARWVSLMKNVTGVTVTTLREIQTNVGASEDAYEEFLNDLWSVLSLKLRGPGETLINGIMERNIPREELWTRAGLAWYEMQRDGVGRTADRECQLHVSLRNLKREKMWNDVPAAVRKLEAMVEEFQLLTGTALPDSQKKIALQQVLPLSLEEKVISHASYDEGFAAWKDHITVCDQDATSEPWRHHPSTEDSLPEPERTHASESGGFR